MRQQLLLLFTGFVLTLTVVQADQGALERLADRGLDVHLLGTSDRTKVALEVFTRMADILEADDRTFCPHIIMTAIEVQPEKSFGSLLLPVKDILNAVTYRYYYNITDTTTIDLDAAVWDEEADYVLFMIARVLNLD